MNTDRIKEIQEETAYPDSLSVQQALLKVWNECEQEWQLKNCNLQNVNGRHLSIKEIMDIRNQLPDTWKWHKCYELGYISSRTGREFTMKHWALTDLENKGAVHSLGLISHDNTSTRAEFMKDVPVQFVEKSLLIIDSLLAQIQRRDACR